MPRLLPRNFKLFKPGAQSKLRSKLSFFFLIIHISVYNFCINGDSEHLGDVAFFSSSYLKRAINAIYQWSNIVKEGSYNHFTSTLKKHT